MPSIYIDRRGASLDFDSGAVVVRVEGERRGTLPLAGVHRMVVRRADRISLRLLAALGERNIGLLVLGGRKGEPMAHLLGAPHNDAVVRLGQFAMAQDTARSLDLARFMVRGKLTGHLKLLRHAMHGRPDARKALHDSSVEIDGLRAKVDEAITVAGLRGLEGAAAASFYRGYVKLFADSLGFTARNRRPPRDPVNACLSLAFTLLHAEAVRAAWLAGLDPHIGFLHAPLPGRQSLASDLLELCRPAAESWVWEQFRNRSLRIDHFSDVDGACLLGKAGRGVFYESFELLATTEARRLRHAAAIVARAARAAYRSAQ